MNSSHSMEALKSVIVLLIRQYALCKIKNMKMYHPCKYAYNNCDSHRMCACLSHQKGLDTRRPVI